jgi:hypothetical protein
MRFLLRRNDKKYLDINFIREKDYEMITFSHLKLFVFESQIIIEIIPWNKNIISNSTNYFPISLCNILK